MEKKLYKSQMITILPTSKKALGFSKNKDPFTVSVSSPNKNSSRQIGPNVGILNNKSKIAKKNSMTGESLKEILQSQGLLETFTLNWGKFKTIKLSQNQN